VRRPPDAPDVPERGPLARRRRARIIAPMNSLLRTTTLLPLLGLCTLLTAQEGEKGKPQDPPKTETAKAQTPPKDQDAAALAKDPAIQAIDKFIAEKNIDKAAGGWKTKLPEPPKLPFDANTDYFWHLDTELGALKIRYYPDVAPMHVSSGIYLARLGFYDDLGFHRIMPRFMAQGGDPLGNGTGGPGYMMEGEFKGKSHDKPGILSMANTGRPRSEGSQFFITFRDTKQLDNGYTIWGEVVDGTDTLKALEGKGRSDNNGVLDKAIKINKTWISVAPKAKAAETPKPADGKEPEKAK
jgi:peptidyl-prolyl cis-trans isomerase B (cyclophilin B)